MNNQRYHEYEQDAFLKHLSKYIGKTVTIFTDSGGKSGLGFTGVLLSVNSYMVSIVTKMGPPPDNPLNHPQQPISFNRHLGGYRQPKNISVGSITDIPVNKIAAFVHNAL
ncbi:hypothetical protein [Vallitalea okinawensis]|uniref:hypothetical protein n=1 Tax=Vallitalea okinawensis TaxID=2078660 RepID=UPI000CFE1222|nr:hypothetical protein [Vallitalea okinawensis]